MTPFGLKIRALRARRDIKLKDMAEAVGVSSAYLSALEHGNRGQPSWYLVQRIIAYFNVIWDEAEEIETLAKISHPKVTIDTSNLSAIATELANVFSNKIGAMSEKELEAILSTLKSK